MEGRGVIPIGNRREEGILGEFSVAPELLDEPDVDRSEDSFKALVDDNCTGTKGAVGCHSAYANERRRKINNLRMSPLLFSLVGVPEDERDSLPLENAPLLRLRISQRVRDLSSSCGVAPGGRPSPKPAYFSFL